MRRRTIRPASAVGMARRIREVLRLLPMSRAELHDQVVILDADEPMFEPALRDAQREGVVIRHPKYRAWFRLK